MYADEYGSHTVHLHLILIDEVENLASRLQVSRQRVAELERGLASAKNSSTQLTKVCIMYVNQLGPVL